MKVLCHGAKAGPLLRLSDGSVLIDLVDSDGNSISLFFQNLEAFLTLVGEMMAETTAQEGELALEMTRLALVRKNFPPLPRRQSSGESFC